MHFIQTEGVIKMKLFEKKPESEEVRKLRANVRNCGHCEEMAKITMCAIFRAANEIHAIGDFDGWNKLFYCCPLFKEIPKREYPRER